MYSEAFEMDAVDALAEVTPETVVKETAIPAGTQIPLSKLLRIGWSLGEIDTAVARGVLSRCSGKSVYVNDRPIY